MKKQLFIITVLTFINLLVFSISHAQNSFDKNFIESSTWETNFTWERIEIIFKDNKYSVICNGECGENIINGTYLISGNKLTLIPSIAKTYLGELYKIKTEWIIEQDNNDLMYIYRLTLLTKIKEPGLYIFWKKEPNVPIGSKRLVGKNLVIKLKFEEKKIQINAKMRKEPNTQSEFYKTKIYNKEQNYISKGKTINILGRTEKKEKIENMNDYWYYCHIVWNPFIGEEGPVNCWIYGSLIDK
jgi:hypothetical protein